MIRSPALCAFLVLFLLSLTPAGAKDVPYLSGRVNDEAKLIPAEQLKRIEEKLEQFERETGNQVAVLTIDSLEGEAIDDYANKVARTWALGQKGKDNGVLLLVARQDRQMRIEVGYGLEPVLTDLQTNIIQNQVIIPYYKRGDFGGGIEAGVDAILSAIAGKPVQPAAAPQPAGRGGGAPPAIFLFILFFVLGPFLLNAIRSRSWVVYVVLLPILFFLGSLVHLIVGMILAGLWLVLFPILRAVLPKRPSSGRFRGPGGGWWIGPGWGGGGWGGGRGGGGFGGFSGGGGSFGGGGSSSSW